MQISLLYAEALPALLSFIITLVWFCVAVAIVPREMPHPLIWSVMALLVAGSVSLFFLPTSVALFLVAIQVTVSAVVAFWLTRSAYITTYLKQARLEMLRNRPELLALNQSMGLHERIVGE
jgi:hypothetical protein